MHNTGNDKHEMLMWEYNSFYMNYVHGVLWDNES